MSMQAVKSALSTSSSVYQKMQESLTTLLSLTRRPPADEKSDSTATPGATSFGSTAVGLSQLLSQYQSASVIAFPKFQSFIDGAVSQAQELLTEIRQNGPTELVVEQLNALTRGLHSTLLSLNTTRTAWFQDLFSKNSEEAEERSPAELSSISAQPSSAAVTTAERDLKESQPVGPKLPTDAKKEEEQLIEKPGSRKKVTPGAAESHEIPNQATLSDDTCKTSEDAGKDSATLDHVSRVFLELSYNSSMHLEHSMVSFSADVG
ncbi:unnamed protein product [Dibothriocephalus latus]|uniref:Uncharacterized protein n=1 Tax=Dibothriocephalus latus TaxID=60516 RepID=A0A3P7LM92_DIBLA|nr:unnamed protein product [Dibothriocephalus latus]